MPRSAGGGSVASRSRPIRNAASVLPEPVGAHRSVCAPRAMAGQPCACAGVGPSGNASANQAARGGREQVRERRGHPCSIATVRLVIESLGEGLHRIRLPLPWSGLDHVWSYALEGPAGWTLFDAGLGTAETAATWTTALPSWAGRWRGSSSPTTTPTTSGRAAIWRR